MGLNATLGCLAQALLQGLENQKDTSYVSFIESPLEFWATGSSYLFSIPDKATTIWTPETTLVILEIKIISGWITLKKVLNNLYLIRRMSYISYELGCSNGISQTSPRSIMDEAKILIKMYICEQLRNKVKRGFHVAMVNDMEIDNVIKASNMPQLPCYFAHILSIIQMESKQVEHCVVFFLGFYRTGKGFATFRHTSKLMDLMTHSGIRINFRERPAKSLTKVKKMHWQVTCHVKDGGIQD
ncbi:hypothetical protein HID58_009513 [Brassica napus]|uniref:Uncharacterized protein n=1 Tax=Brassica napus TaxID=3708 RepID=A0ABQ8DSU1_BRANA|nr:hypothetical protein HID58_009513 [Brassica napus]